MYNKNIYDIFEERKFDVFYIENFSFNDLDEIDMVFENIEKYILDDEYVIMEGFKDKIKDMKGNIKEKIKKFFQAIDRLLNNMLRNFNEKYEPLKKYIEKVGKDNIIKKLEGRKVRMYKFQDSNKTIKSIRNWLEIAIERHLDEKADYDDYKEINSRTSGKYIEMLFEPYEGEIQKNDIEILIGYVYNYDKFMKTFDDMKSQALKKFNMILNKIDENDKKAFENINGAMRGFNEGINTAIKTVNKALIILAKLIGHVKVNDKRLDKDEYYKSMKDNNK